MVAPGLENTIIELDYSLSEQEDENTVNGADENINGNIDVSIDNAVTKGYNRKQ